MATGLGQLETQALAFAQRQADQRIESGSLEQALKWTAEQERKVLSRLAKKGMIVRIRRGLYLAPATLPVGGRWSPGEFVALDVLIRDSAGAYQISGPSTFYRYGWTEQVPNRVYAYNNRISGDRSIGPINITLIKVADERLGGTEVVPSPDNIDVVYASRARALVDAVYDWSRFDSLPKAYGWIRAELKKSDAFAAELVEATIRFANQGTRRRIGACLEQAAVAESLLRKLDRQLPQTTATIPLDPTRPKIGAGSKRWGVVLNNE